jgi:sulfur-oxidizing protein SoxY
MQRVGLGMRVRRRTLIEGVLTVWAALGLPLALRAETGPAAAFEATDADEALCLLFSGRPVNPSDAVTLTLPQRIDNGANVSVTVATTLAGARSIAVVVERNPRPLAALFELAAGTRPSIGCRIKVAESGAVRAVVETDQGLFGTAVDVTVTVGGCA